MTVIVVVPGPMAVIWPAASTLAIASFAERKVMSSGGVPGAGAASQTGVTAI